MSRFVVAVVVVVVVVVVFRGGGVIRGFRIYLGPTHRIGEKIKEERKKE